MAAMAADIAVEVISSATCDAAVGVVFGVAAAAVAFSFLLFAALAGGVASLVVSFFVQADAGASFFFGAGTVFGGTATWWRSNPLSVCMWIFGPLPSAACAFGFSSTGSGALVVSCFLDAGGVSFGPRGVITSPSSSLK